jgi:stage II sporulation protein AA (anti-sigma F factor antagonist)
VAGRADDIKGKLRVAVRPLPDENALVLILAGELDHDSAEVMRDALAGALVSRTARVLVDCAELHFCDSSGLNALLRSRLAGREAGTRLDLLALQPPVARMLDITGARAVFHVYASLDEALADHPQRQRP